MAIKNFKRNKKQYRSIVMSLVLSIVLFVTTSSFVDCLTTISESAKIVTDYDIGLGTQKMSDSDLCELYEKLKTVDGVTSSTLQAIYEVSLEAENKTYKATLQFVDEESFQALLEKWNLNHLPAIAKWEKAEAKSISDLPNLFSSENVLATINGVEVTLETLETLMPDIPPFTGVVESKDYYLQIIAPWSLKEQLIEKEEVQVKGITFCSDNSTWKERSIKK